MRSVKVGALALGLGLVGLGFLFTDSPSIWVNLTEAAVFFFVSGLVIGYLDPERWWISGLTAWMGLLVLGAELLTANRFRDAPTVDVTIADGQLSVSPSVVPPGWVRMRETNQGSTTHHLGSPRLERIGTLERVKGRKLGLEELRSTSKRLTPNDTFAYYSSLQPGRYLIICLEETPAGMPHRDLGEVVELVVE